MHPSRFFKSAPCLLTAAACISISLLAAIPAGARDTIPDRLFHGKSVPYRLPEPAAPMPGRDTLVPPAGEEQYFPIRADGQPYVTNIDRTTNLTDWINHWYFDPHWRGEEWCPFDSIEQPERAVRMLSSWQDYDQQTEGRVGNHVAKFLEKWTGYGP